MAITEEQVYAALGIEKPADKPEAADPATIEGENEQGVTDPAGAEEVQAAPQEAEREQEPAATEQPEQKTEAEAEGAAKSTQSKEERAEQARLRREREKKAAVDAAVSDAAKKAKEAHDAELAEIFAAMGATDRFHGGKPITNLKEFQEWQAANQAAGLNRKLKAGELTAEDLQAVVDASPVMQQAKAALANIEARETAAKQQQAKAEFEKIMERELAEINALDPGVKTLEDAMALPTGSEFVRLVNERGLSYIEAFKLANIDRLTRARSLGAAEGKAQQQHSKDHLRAIGIAGGPSVEVPAETVRLYRELNPEMSMEQIREHYVKTMGIR